MKKEEKENEEEHGENQKKKLTAEMGPALASHVVASRRLLNGRLACGASPRRAVDLRLRAALVLPLLPLIALAGGPLMRVGMVEAVSTNSTTTKKNTRNTRKKRKRKRRGERDRVHAERKKEIKNNKEGREQRRRQKGRNPCLTPQYAHKAALLAGHGRDLRITNLRVVTLGTVAAGGVLLDHAEAAVLHLKMERMMKKDEKKRKIFPIAPWCRCRPEPQSQQAGSVHCTRQSHWRGLGDRCPTKEGKQSRLGREEGRSALSNPSLLASRNGHTRRTWPSLICKTMHKEEESEPGLSTSRPIGWSYFFCQTDQPLALVAM
jgi:hypothetical protein